MQEDSENKPLYLSDEINDDFEAKAYNFKELLVQTTYLKNFIAMCVGWSSVNFGQNMMGLYIKYLPGDVYINAIMITIMEFCASFISGLLSNKLGTKRTLLLSYFIAAAFGLLFIFY